ncbi:MAG TPA: (Fe-S)-binding protein [Candidatus Lokiarchaeia archaeon]|nr:(Fe-S)-binding protein [Candidatus Lokiarchaeia archaeon]
MTQDQGEEFKHLSKVQKYILQCIGCGDCREATDITAEPPKSGVCVAREHSSGFEPFFGRGKMQIIRSVWEKKLPLSKDMAEIIYQCPTCNACSEACAYDMDNVELYEALRGELVDAGYCLEKHADMSRSLVDQDNPYGRENAQKGDWLKALDVPVKRAPDEKAEVLYFVGCTAAFTPELQSVATSTVNVLRKLGIDFTVLADQEVCCGSVALRTGFCDAFESVAKKNAALIAESGVKTVITSCAGCYRTLKRDYPEYMTDFNVKVMHTVEFLDQVISENKPVLKNLGVKATYHDPCHAGRHTGIYEEPRRILAQIVDLVEMPTIKENAKCCGAGGGVKKAFPDLALEIAKSRVKEAEDTGAQYLVSICPFCHRNLSDALNALQSPLIMIDLIELLDQALEDESK